MDAEDGFEVAVVTRTDLTASSGPVTLAGSVWLPDSPPRALVVMHPGSGPSDRDNDVFFPPIREALLAAGAAVASFDKRGVGGSTGSWLEAGIIDQARDLAAGVRAAAAHVPRGTPVGLFGHSQGGWVVLEAAGALAPAFVITSSGPSVSPREQETFSTANSLARETPDTDLQAGALRVFRELLEKATSGVTFTQIEAWLNEPDRADLVDLLESAGAVVPRDPELWAHAALIIDHDPAPALAGLDAPLLAVLGASDTVVPVQKCARLFRELVRPGLLTLTVIPDADHRIQRLGTGELAPEYLPTLTDFVRRVTGLD